MFLAGPSILSHSRSSIYNGLLGRWRLDESSGNAYDTSGANKYPGTVNGGVTQNVTGHRRSAYQFDGVNDYVSMQQAALMSALSGLTTCAVSFWAAATSYEANEAAFGMGEAGSNNVLSIYPFQDGGKKGDLIEVWYNGDTIIQEDATHSADGTFHHFLYQQLANNSHEFYLNNTLIATATDIKSIDANIDIVNIGSYDGNEEEYTGSVDDVFLWNRSLTTAERLYIYNL